MKKAERTDEVLLEYIHECIERIQEYTDGGRSAFLKSRSLAFHGVPLLVFAMFWHMTILKLTWTPSGA